MVNIATEPKVQAPLSPEVGFHPSVKSDVRQQISQNIREVFSLAASDSALSSFLRSPKTGIQAFVYPSMSVAYDDIVGSGSRVTVPREQFLNSDAYVMGEILIYKDNSIGSSHALVLEQDSAKNKSRLLAAVLNQLHDINITREKVDPNRSNPELAPQDDREVHRRTLVSLKSIADRLSRDPKQREFVSQLRREIIPEEERHSLEIITPKGLKVPPRPIAGTRIAD